MQKHCPILTDLVTSRDRRQEIATFCMVLRLLGGIRAVVGGTIGFVGEKILVYREIFVFFMVSLYSGNGESL